MIEDRELDIATIERTPPEFRTEKQREVWNKYIKDKEEGDNAVADYWNRINQKNKQEASPIKIEVGEILKGIKITNYTNPINLSQYSLEEVKALLTEFYKQQVLARKASCEFTDAVRQVINDTSRWLIKPTKPGLLLRGYVGVGKTTMLYCIKQILDACIGKVLRVEDAYSIAELALTNKDAFNRIKTTPMLGIDDLGVDDKEKKSYGNAINPLVELITYRNKHMLYTIITTNYATDRIEKEYGKRVEERIRELCNTINYDSKMKSFRL